MTKILIREDVPVLERLLTAITNRAGYETLSLDATVTGEIEGDLLLVDPMSAGALEWINELRLRRPSLPIVCIGSDPLDPQAHEIQPSAIVAKPFQIGTLEQTIADALRYH